MNLSQRIDQPELMDTMTLTLPVMRQTLDFLSMTNRYFGGITVILKYLKSWSKNWKRTEPISILDIGTGGAEIPIAIAKWARQAQLPIKITGIDLMPDIVKLAQERAQEYPEIKVLKKDLFDLANEEKFDYVLASLFLHHTSPDQTISAIKTMDKIAKKGVIVSDLLRSYPSYIAITLLCTMMGNKIVRHDGPLSVKRSFRPKELQELAKNSNCSYLLAKKEPWFRISLAGEKNLV